MSVCGSVPTELEVLDPLVLVTGGCEPPSLGAQVLWRAHRAVSPVPETEVCNVLGIFATKFITVLHF